MEAGILAPAVDILNMEALGVNAAAVSAALASPLGVSIPGGGGGGGGGGGVPGGGLPLPLPPSPTASLDGDKTKLTVDYGYRVFREYAQSKGINEVDNLPVEEIAA